MHSYHVDICTRRNSFKLHVYDLTLMSGGGGDGGGVVTGEKAAKPVTTA